MTMMMEITMATIGRLMKNFDMRPRPKGSAGGFQPELQRRVRWFDSFCSRSGARHRFRSRVGGVHDHSLLYLLYSFHHDTLARLERSEEHTSELQSRLHL